MSDISNYMEDYWRRVNDSSYSDCDEDTSDEYTWLEYVRSWGHDVLNDEDRPLFEFNPFYDADCFEFNSDSEQWVYT